MSRLLAARLLERNLLRIGRAGVLVDRRLAPFLDRLRARRLYRLLGYVRLGDYLTERLGMSLRRCQAILRLERVLASLPALGRALQAGEVSLSRIEAIAGVATAATEDFWLDRARSLSVAGLRQAARVARPDGAMFPDRIEAVDKAAADADPSVAQGSAPESIEQDESGCLVSFAAPGPVVGVWHWTLDLVRRIAGQQEPAWRCVEYLAAEFLSGVPEGAPGEIGSAVTGAAPGPAGDPGGAGDRSAAARPPAPAVAAAAEGGTASTGDAGAGGASAWDTACEAVREALSSIGGVAPLDDILSGPPRGVADDEPDAWELDARLRRLVRLRQSLAWRQGRLLAAFSALRLHVELGFSGLDDWIEHRLPMSPRRSRYLTSLDRRLRPLPLVAEAYRRGSISWCQARLLVRVVAPDTQRPWIGYARRVTVRRLEEAVVACEVESGGPAHIGASPLPPVEPSPGREDDAAVGSAVATTPLHISAPLSEDDVAPPTNDVALPSDYVAPPSDDLAPSSDYVAPPFDDVAPRSDDEAPPSRDVAPSSRVRMRRIAFWAPLDVATLWESALRACRAAQGARLDDWECLLLMVRAMRDTWDNPDDPQWKRRYRIFERDGWRCRAPGCSSRSGLNEHHIVFRSHQGDDAEDNLVTLCVGHHQLGVHAGRLACSGRAPGSLWWDLGIRPGGGDPLVRYFGDSIVTRRPGSGSQYRRPGSGSHSRRPASVSHSRRPASGSDSRRPGAVDLRVPLSHNLPFDARSRA